MRTHHPQGMKNHPLPLGLAPLGSVGRVYGVEPALLRQAAQLVEAAVDEGDRGGGQELARCPRRSVRAIGLIDSRQRQPGCRMERPTRMSPMS